MRGQEGACWSRSRVASWSRIFRSQISATVKPRTSGGGVSSSSSLCFSFLKRSLPKTILVKGGGGLFTPTNNGLFFLSPLGPAS